MHRIATCLLQTCHGMCGDSHSVVSGQLLYIYMYMAFRPPLHMMSLGAPRLLTTAQKHSSLSQILAEHFAERLRFAP